MDVPDEASEREVAQNMLDDAQDNFVAGARLPVNADLKDVIERRAFWVTCAGKPVCPDSFQIKEVR